MKDIAIISSVRTALGKGFKGSLKDTRPDVFGAIVVKEAVRRAGIEPSKTDDLAMGYAMPEAEQGMNIARTIGLLSGLPNTTSAVTVNRFCSSGLHAIADIAKSIQVGQIEIGVGGGVESMSMVPMGGHKPSACPELMEILPQADQDMFALQSHQKALKAIQNGYFKDEIVGFETSVFDDMGVFEINEAFAAQALYCVRELKLNPEIVNPCGGAIALGHPLGCTGARQVATILREMQRKKARYGVCAMCIGGGMGAAALIELVN